MPTLITPAIVMRKMDFRESSRILWLFTRKEGKFSALAKGAHRRTSKFMGALDLFHLLEATLSIHAHREIQLLTSAMVLNSFPTLGKDPIRLAAGANLIETANLALPEGRPDPPLFDLLSSGLTLMERFPKTHLLLAIQAWQIRFLDVLGFSLALDCCATCGKKMSPPGREISFSTPAGGLLCRLHREENRFERLPWTTLSLLKTLREARAVELANLALPVEDLRRTRRILENSLGLRLEKPRVTTKVLHALAQEKGLSA